MKRAIKAYEHFERIRDDGHGSLPSDIDERIERSLRTYILAGIAPEELEKRTKDSHERMQRRINASRRDGQGSNC